MTPTSSTSLFGSRCGSCGIASFPVSDRCRCCGSRSTRRVDLGSTGKIETWSSSGEIVVAEVRLACGVLAMGRLVSGTPSAGGCVQSVSVERGVGFVADV